MDQPQPITDEVFTAFLKCKYKAYLKLTGAFGEKSDYEKLQRRLDTEYRVSARAELLRKHPRGATVESPESLVDAIRRRAALITDVTASDGGEVCRLDALERPSREETDGYRPVLFCRRERVTAEDRLLLAFGASVLAHVHPPLRCPAAGGRRHHRPARAEAEAPGETRDGRGDLLP
jgi:hypothetical protein